MNAVKFTVAYIGVGSNIGDRVRNISAAAHFLCSLTGITLERTSSLYETAPVGPGQRDFINAVLKIRTSLSPVALLDALKEIEKKMGRKAGKRWGPRVIDLDLLLYGKTLVSAPGLTVPHPEMANRRFVLVPLAELAPGLVHPQLRKTVSTLLARLTSVEQKVKIIRNKGLKIERKTCRIK
jgi:2-amino-4-hydroxy-6-hydroxymethyldihydropteridine diphosphokinase